MYKKGSHELILSTIIAINESSKKVSYNSPEYDKYDSIDYVSISNYICDSRDVLQKYHCEDEIKYLVEFIKKGSYVSTYNKIVFTRTDIIILGINTSDKRSESDFMCILVIDIDKYYRKLAENLERFSDINSYVCQEKNQNNIFGDIYLQLYKYRHYILGSVIFSSAILGNIIFSMCYSMCKYIFELL